MISSKTLIYIKDRKTKSDTQLTMFIKNKWYTYNILQSKLAIQL